MPAEQDAMVDIVSEPAAPGPASGRIGVLAWLQDGERTFAAACSGMLASQIDLTLVRDEAAFIAAMPGRQVLILSGGHYSRAVADALADTGASVRWIQFASAGFELARRHGMPGHIVLTNAATAFSNVVAEHAMALMLAATRRIVDADRLRQSAQLTRAALLPTLDTLEGQTLVIVGYGGIGQAVAARANAFGMKVIVVARRPPGVGSGVAEAYTMNQLHEALGKADTVVMAIALNDETRSMIDAEALAAMRPHVCFVNVSRGGVVDEPALIDTLENGRIGFAALDVTADEPPLMDSPLRRLPNVIVTPHVAGFGGDRINDRMAALIADNLARHVRGEPLMNVVNG